MNAAQKAFDTAIRTWKISNRLDELMAFIGDDAEKIGQWLIDNNDTGFLTVNELSKFYGRKVQSNEEETGLEFADAPKTDDASPIVRWMRAHKWS